MRNLFLAACLFLATSIHAASVITASITVTNKTVNGDTIVINGSTRTWTNSVSIPASQIGTNATALGSTTNLLLHYGANQISGISATYGETNVVNLKASPGQALTVTAGGTWAAVSYTTNQLTNAILVRVPYDVESEAQQTNIMSELVRGLRAGEVTNAFFESSPAVANLVGLTNAQTISGVKQFTNAANLIRGIIDTPTITNAQFYGGISSRGTTSGSEQYGNGADATGVYSTAVGADSLASGTASSAFGKDSFASGDIATAIGDASEATAFQALAVGASAESAATNATAIGTAAVAVADGATAIGAEAYSGYTNSTAVGYRAVTTANNQVMLGSTNISTHVSSALTVGTDLTVSGSIVRAQFSNTNNFPAGSDIGFGRYALTSLANGNNAAVAVGTNVFVEVSGPSAAFTINGIAGGRDGKMVIILNQTTYNMTIAHDSGVDPTAGNRIYSMTGADRATTGNGAAILIYNANASRWILISLDQ